MNAEHYLNKAISSLHTFNILSGGSAFSTAAMNLLKNINETDYEAIGDPSKDDEPTALCKGEYEEGTCESCPSCITETISHPAGESTASIESERCEEGYFDHP